MNPAEDIRDIRPVMEIPEWWRWPLAVAVAALAAFAGVMLLRYWRRRRARALTPLQRALAALRTAEAHARAGRSREWADIVADTVRDALAARLGAEVLPQNTSELAVAAPAGGALPPWPSIIGLLEACDLTRFAQATLVEDALLANTALAHDLVAQLHAPPPSQVTP